MILRHEGFCPPAPHGLVANGPLVTVSLGWHPDDTEELLGIPKPEFPKRKMMIDTGAAFTLVEADIPVSLGLHPVRYRDVIGVSQKPEPRPVFRMSIGLEMGDGVSPPITMVFREDVVGMPPPDTREVHVGLLGRDFLRHFEFIYDGPNARFELIREHHPRPRRS